MTHANTRLGHLDGLRAIAVLGVLLFHFKLPYFGGGYAGVDIFLSLSGFLITRNIVHDISADTFSLRQFYIRRLFRLLPSSTAIILLTCFATYGIMAPGLLQAALDSARAALLFHANIYFHTKSGYFEDAPDLKPLLHMWSLSLEEQFYFLWAPLLVVLACLPFRNRVMPAAALVLAAISLTVAVLTNGMYPSFVFFELPPRIFQFAAGAFLAFMPALRRSSQAVDGPSLALHETDQPAEEKVVPSSVAASVVSNTISLVSVVTIFGSFAKLPPAASALHMLPTTLATCALIATPTSLLSRYVLSARVPSHIGDLSYAMYLVHWPLYVLGKYLLQALMMPDPHALLLLAVTYVLGLALHHGVENPVRNSRNVLARRVFVVTAAGVLLAALAGSELLLSAGVASGVERSVSGSRDLVDGLAPGRTKAYLQAGAVIRTMPEKLPHMVRHIEIGAEDAQDSGLVLIGNSYAMQLVRAMGDVMVSRKLRMTVFARGGCTFAGRNVTVRNWGKCAAPRDIIWGLLDGLNRTGLVVMVANDWVEKDGLTLDIQTKVLYEDLHAAGHKLAIVGRPPMSTLTSGGELWNYFQCVDFNRPNLLAGKRNKCVDLSVGYCANGNSATDQRFTDVIEKYKLPVPQLNFQNYMCRDDDSCRMGKRCRYPVHNDTAVEEVGFVRNLNHLSAKASFNIAYVFQDFLFAENTGILDGLLTN